MWGEGGGEGDELLWQLVRVLEQTRHSMVSGKRLFLRKVFLFIESCFVILFFVLNINKKEFISRYFQLTMEFFDVKWKKKLNKIEIKFILKEEIFIRGKTWFHDKYLPV